ncbi:MAG TPA: GTPase [Herminiimonas sp.]|jgi:hypothetical protein|nr:GTPase [Herminiimonas sp.]
MTRKDVTLATLVTGARAGLRETAIAERIDPALHTAVILEGLPDGSDPLQQASVQPHLKIVRIAPGCMHCIGNLVMRVTLNRMLRDKPQRLFVSVASGEHIEQLRQFLLASPYDALLSLTENIAAES